MADLVWDERLISRERALELAGRWPIYFETEPIVGLLSAMHVRCWKCDQSCGRFIPNGGDRFPDELHVEDLLSAVLRHAVMAHDLVLSGAGQGDHDG